MTRLVKLRCKVRNSLIAAHVQDGLQQQQQQHINAHLAQVDAPHEVHLQAEVDTVSSGFRVVEKTWLLNQFTPCMHMHQH